MTLHAALAAAATLVSFAFALSTFERWLRARKPHEAAWTASLLLFAAGSAALWVAAAGGWSAWSFRAFYLFGAIINVPFLAVGTVYLLTSRRVADRAALGVVVASAFAAGVVVVAPLGPLGDAAIPQGSKVFGGLPRALAGVGSGGAAVVIVVGAVVSAWRLLRVRRAGGFADRRGGITPGRLAAANLVIAVGTLVLGAGGLFNSVLDQMDGFSVSLVLGVVLLFGGFLLTNPPSVGEGEGSAEGPAQDLPAHTLGEAVDDHDLVRALVAGEPLGAPGDDPLLLE